MNQLFEMGVAAKDAATQMAKQETHNKDHALVILAALLRNEQEQLLACNQRDLSEARAAGIGPAMLDRLSLEGRLEEIADGVLSVVKLPDPVGEVFHEQTLSNGLRVLKQRTPIGVLGVIYEARPNVTIDVAALAIKSGNCAILRGGKEALHTNRALVEVVSRALRQAGLPAKAVQFIDDPNRDTVTQLLKMHDYVDLIIPRGGSSLHEFCRNNSIIPVITGGMGICHLFVDEDVDLVGIMPVIENAKIQRPSACNALDTVLVHTAVADQFFSLLIERLGGKGVVFSVAADSMDRFKQYLPEGFESVRLAGDHDWDTEWLGLTLGVKIVGSLDEAINHIQAHSQAHSDGILTRNMEHAKRFVREVDSAAVYVNASTRFTDGGQLGLGAEVAVSTQKLHARGPMGLQELTSYKWVVWGDNTIRAS